MHAIKTAALAASFIVAGIGGALAQDADGTTLPDICITEAGTAAAGAMPSMGMDQQMEVDEAHAALMSGMDRMNKNMTTAQMAEDIDVAFACAMIPHHQAALDMAKAELQYGDDQWAKDKAQQVIDAQTKEIEELKNWLAEKSVQ